LPINNAALSLKKLFYRFGAWVRFYLQANTRYRIHSPLAFEWTSEVLEDDRYYYFFKDIERLRRVLRGNRQPHVHQDLGAGKSGPRSNQHILQHAAATSEKGRFLFRMTRWRQPATLLEIGVSLGIGALYLHNAVRKSRYIGLEGCPDCAQAARDNLFRFQLCNADILTGDFAETLPQALRTLGVVDMVYFDGNHSGTATLRYFEQCLPFTTTQSVFIFDDIYWSAEMTASWNHIRADERVALSIDCFDFGIVFFDPSVREKQHFKVLRSFWKPWQKFLP
jgi:predicted O-methyltransferase YrrM